MLFVVCCCFFFFLNFFLYLKLFHRGFSLWFFLHALVQVLDEEDELPELELPSSCHLSRLLLLAFMKKLLTVLSSNPSCWEMVICNSLDGRLFSLNIAWRVRRWTSVKTNLGFLGVLPLSFPCSCSFLLQAFGFEKGWCACDPVDYPSALPPFGPAGSWIARSLPDQHWEETIPGFRKRRTPQAAPLAPGLGGRHGRAPHRPFVYADGGGEQLRDSEYVAPGRRARGQQSAWRPLLPLLGPRSPAGSRVPYAQCWLLVVC